MELFDNKELDSAQTRKLPTPLADRMRPSSLDQLVGQDKLVGKGKLLRSAIEKDELASMILWGPPGCGKTTLAHIIAKVTDANYVSFSAVMSGIKEVKEVMIEASQFKKMHGKRTILFIDEIHRFNKSQQDAFLPYIEKGDIILIGATTENPSFEVNSALLSRCKVYVLEPLDAAGILKILKRALEEDNGLKKLSPQISEEDLKFIAENSSSDARKGLNTLEFAVLSADPQPDGTRKITKEIVKDALQRGELYYDKHGEEHYNIISALHKSIRNSDVDAGLYWLARMLEGGEDPLYVVRRLIRFASEDVGNADPQALSLAIAAKETVHFIGMPEGALALAQLVVYLCSSPKSNTVYTAYESVIADIRAGKVYPVPLQIRNAPTKLMKELDYGKGYKYAHEFEEGVADMECLPDELKGKKYYSPKEIGFEREIKKRLEYFTKLKKEIGSKNKE
jgi:putative ATPase